MNDIFRTAFEYIETKLTHSFGRGLPHGINQICRCCQAGSLITGTDSVSRIIDTVELKPWAEFYNGKREYQAYKCHSCGYTWSWYKRIANGVTE